MSTERGISLLLGTGGGFFAAAQSPTPATTTGFLSILPKYGIKDIDTAAVYHNVYSPTAGGLFASTPSSRYQEHNPGAANWIGMYKGSSKLDEGIDKVRKIAGENGIEAMELALRWAVHDSPLRIGDGVIIGARNEEQLVQNLEWIEKGRLPEGVKEILNEIWDDVEDVAPGRV